MVRPTAGSFACSRTRVLAAGRFGRCSTNDMPVHRGSHGGNHADIASSTVDHSAGGGGPGGDGRDGCLIHASFGTSELQNADSARLCRFRKSQQKHKLTGPNLLAQNLSVSDLKSSSLAG